MADQSLPERYICQAITRACDVIAAFPDSGTQLRLRDIVERTGLKSATVFRVLFTLEQRGLVLRAGPRRYQLAFRPPRRRKYRMGYAAQTQEFAFSRAVEQGI